VAKPERWPDSTRHRPASPSEAREHDDMDRGAPRHRGNHLVGTLLAFASLVLLALVLWAAWTRDRARQALRDAGLAEGAVLSINAIRQRGELAGLQQAILKSSRYGISGKPDRIVQTNRGPAPVDVKKCVCPRNGRPYDGHIAQVATYCLLLEEKFKCRVYEGVIDYIDRSVTVPF
jgi:hypothetical protein